MRKGIRIFGETRALEAKFDEFLDCIVEASIIFERGVSVYLSEGAAAFEDSLDSVGELESRADALRTGIETKLYEHTLIPDLRGDVMQVLEDMDKLLNVCQNCSFRISIEHPDVPEEFHAGFINLIETCVECANAAVLAARAFLRDTITVRDHTHKVVVLETEADKQVTKLMRAVFASELQLDQKIHLRYFAERFDALANVSEDAAQRLSIFALKRSI